MRKFPGGALAALMVAIPLGGAAQAPPEMRACWVSRYEWPSTNRTTAQNNIRNIMRTLREHNFNAVLFQIRGECNTLYPSSHEPWGPQFNWTNPGWDPLAFAIAEARANGLEFHAYINTHTITASIPPANTTPQHLYNLHGTNAAESWAIHDINGVPQGVVDSYVWTSPGVPGAMEWTRRAIRHVVENYDVDGLHFDRIRTPGSGYSYDPISLARFNGDGNPDGESWGDWQRNQITRMLRDIYGETMMRKPHIKLSAAPFGICRKVPGGYQGTGTESYFSWHQDSFGWMQAHVLDCLFPQIYWDIGSAHPYEVLLSDFLARDGGRHIYGGLVTSRDVIAQVIETRRQGALGTTVFSFNSVPFARYLNEVYTEPAPIPEMPWKTNPTTAIIVGRVLAPEGGTVVDSLVRRTGDSYNYLSANDGFFAILDVPPGEFTVSASKAGYRGAEATVTLAAGDVREVTLRLRSNTTVLRFDTPQTPLVDGARLTMEAVDFPTTGPLVVEVSSPSEPTGELVTMTPSAEPGVYTGTLSLRQGTAGGGDGWLAVRPSEVLTARYVNEPEGVSLAATTTVTAPEWLIDNDTAGFSFTGAWLTSSFGANYGASKRYIAPGDGTATATWAFTGLPAGVYTTEFWVNNSNYAREARYVVEHDGAPAGEVVLGNQNNVGDGWQPLGRFAATGGTLRLTVDNAWTGGGVYVVADAMRLTPSGWPLPTEAPGENWLAY